MQLILLLVHGERLHHTLVLPILFKDISTRSSIEAPPDIPDTKEPDYIDATQLVMGPLSQFANLLRHGVSDAKGPRGREHILRAVRNRRRSYRRT